MKPELDIWEQYGPLFSIEERIIFPPDPRELEFYRSIRSRYPGTCVELGAGDGRLATTISSGSLTVGLEPSEVMCSLWKVEDIRSARRIRGTAQSLPFVSSSFDLILFPYNGIHCVIHREERRKLLSETSRVLSPGGVFCMEACHRFSCREVETDALRYSHSNDGVNLRLVESVEHDQMRKVVSFRMSYSGYSVPDGQVELDLDLAHISCSELLTDLKSAGMSILSLWGDYDYSPWDLEYSPRLLILAERTDS